MVVEVVEGWTGPLDFQLLADGVPPDLTGMAVEMVLKTQDQVAIDTAGDITVTDAPTAQVRYSPDPADLVAGDGLLTLRFKVTDGASKVVYFPNGQADTVRIYRP